MAYNWRANLVFVDEKGNVTRRSFRRDTVGLDFSVEGSQVWAELEDLRSAYAAVSDASVGASLTVAESGAMAAAGAGSDVSDVAHVNLYLTPPPAEKLANISIPSPVDALFAGGAAGTEVDISNASLIALVELFETEWEISDGENVDVSVTNGIKDGEWRSRKYNPR